MILIVGGEEEFHAKYIYDKLVQKNEKAVFFDTRKIPNDITISWNASDRDFKNGYFKIGGQKIFFSDIKSVYWRNHYGYSQPLAQGFPELQYLLQREITSAFNSVFKSSDWLWCNSINAIEMHKNKIFQLNLMAQNNIRVPKTLITNNKEDIKEFFINNDKKIIFKPVLGGAHTQKFTEEMLKDEDLKTLINSPVQFQEMINGVDIRVYVIGQDIFAAKIVAETLDFRADENAKIIPIELPQNIKDYCLQIMQLFELNYSGIDIRLTEEGEYVFIEANPAPMFVHFERQSGYPISDTLIEMLCCV